MNAQKVNPIYDGTVPNSKPCEAKQKGIYRHKLEQERYIDREGCNRANGHGAKR